MKQNTLVIALAALLVGGVATAGYMNSRGDSQPAPVAAPLNANADILGPNGEPLPLDAAIPASGRLNMRTSSTSPRSPSASPCTPP